MMYHEVAHFAQEFVPFIAPMVTHYAGETPLFDLYRVEEDLQNALKRRVELKSGGYLIIDQTEAMTTIDVNTGSYVGARCLEDTVYKTNLEATHAIAPPNSSAKPLVVSLFLTLSICPKRCTEPMY